MKPMKVVVEIEIEVESPGSTEAESQVEDAIISAFEDSGDVLLDDNYTIALVVSEEIRDDDDPPVVEDTLEDEDA